MKQTCIKLTLIGLSALFGYSAVYAKENAPTYSEDKIIGIENFRGSLEAKEMLLDQGFVVTDEVYRQICSFYVHRGPAFITTDSLLYAYYVNLEKAVEKLEMKNAELLPPIIREARARLEVLVYGLKSGEESDYWSEIRADGLKKLIKKGYYDKEWLDRAEEVDDFLLVAEVLATGFGENEELRAGREDKAGRQRVLDIGISEKEELLKECPETVRSEIELIYKAEGIAESPLRGVPIDYSRFKPYGFYARTKKLGNFYRATTWLHDVPFRIDNENEIKQICLLADVFNIVHVDSLIYIADIAENPLDSITGPYERFLGEPDDESLTTLGRSVGGFFYNKTSPAEKYQEWTEIRGAIDELGSPTIPSVPDPLAVKDPAAYRGFRLIPRPTIYDNYVHRALTPFGKERPPVSGEELMAVLGSNTAKEIVMAREGTAIDDYSEIFEDAVEVGKQREEECTELWRLQKQVFDTLLEPPSDKSLPVYYLHPNWRYKDLNTCLGGWAHYRYIWNAHINVDLGCTGLIRQPPGVIEPNLSFFEALLKLNVNTEKFFKEVARVPDTGFGELTIILAEIIPILRKQLEGRELSESDIAFLEDYGTELGHVCGFEHESPQVDNFLPDTPFYVRTSMDLYSGKSRLVGLAKPRAIYVICEINGEYYLTVGGVLSYADYVTGPQSDIISIDDWIEATTSGKIQPPEWQKHFH